MSKIAFFDSWNKKFSGPIVEHWERLGHTVRFNPTWDNAKGADISFFYQADNVLIKATEEIEGIGSIYAQCVDIEVWAGQPFAVKWERVSGCLFIAKHIKSYVESKMAFPQNTRLALIKPGIDLGRFYLRPEPDFDSRPIRKIAYVVGDRRIWDVKRLDIAFQLLKDLLASTKLIWQLHIRGTYSVHEQYNRYCQYLEKDLGIKDFVVWYPERIDDLSKWLDDKDYLLLPSTKEAFSYATAEAMAKGIKPIINNWEGSKDTWGRFVCDTYGEMLAEMTKGPYEPKKYRGYVSRNYDEKRYLDELDGFIRLKGGDK